MSNAVITDWSVTRLQLWESVTLSFAMLMCVCVCVCVCARVCVSVCVGSGECEQTG